MADKSKRGFGSMDINKRREIASKGGQAAHQKGTAHEFTPEEASFAGRKGGKAASHREPEHQFVPQEPAMTEGRPELAQPAGHETPAVSGT
jgi:uncharacterized protein